MTNCPEPPHQATALFARAGSDVDAHVLPAADEHGYLPLRAWIGSGTTVRRLHWPTVDELTTAIAAPGGER